jgi:CRP-like cAMP-binding protein
VTQSTKYDGPNRLLAALSRRDFDLLEPHLVDVDLPVRKSLERPNRRITAAYFPEDGIASVVANGKVGSGVEVGLIGREGMTGGAVLLGADRATYDTFMQVPGDGFCMKIADLKRCAAESESLRAMILKFVHAFNVQVAHTAMINARSTLEERLARWLLVSHDRLEGDELLLTHEFIATMLGVRRPGVTIAVHALQKDGLIQAGRGTITIVDRKGLEKKSNGAYGVAEAELGRLLHS